MEENKEKIENKFFDLIGFVFSFFNSILASFKLFFLVNTPKVKTIFFDFFDFIFRLWPRYFWKKPTLYKIGRFIKDFIDFMFYR
ncbi:hypothetical protein EOM39_06685 [Candidatus Gracilibacteria bacterium]|nr:hypothetical protein [Candidatus Gracilibacteria bacterium]